MDARHRAAGAFKIAFGAEPGGVAFAPGRVNLIGDHEEFNDGLILPMPLSMGTAVAWRRTEQILDELDRRRGDHDAQGANRIRALN